VCDLPWALCDMGFPYCLQRIYSLSVLLPDLHHLSKAALANDLEQVERFDRQGFAADRTEGNLQVE